MFDLMQMFAARVLVEAHGRLWLALYKVPEREGSAMELYLAAPAEDVYPAPVSVIRLDRPLAEYLLRQDELRVRLDALVEERAKVAQEVSALAAALTGRAEPR